MNDENNPSSSDSDGGTRVDLGDDLLQEKTVMISGVVPSKRDAPATNPFLEPEGEKAEDSPGSIADLIQSAKILTNEGLVDDAKKTLHQVLIADPGNAVAKQLLVEIQELELKQIIEGAETRRPFGRRQETSLPEVDVEALMRQLDQDLNLGIFSDAIPAAHAGQLSLFYSNELLQDFCLRLERQLVGATTQDWIDLGIGFLEMELYLVAIHLFAGAWKRLDPEAPETAEVLLSATCLLAFSLILAGRPFEAVARIQPLLRDVEIKRENKAELIYLMGRTYESMKKYDLAQNFYKQVLEIDARYRDVDLRLQKLGKIDV